MHNTVHNQAPVKVAVYTAQATSPEVKQQNLQELLAFTLIGLSTLVAFWIV